MASRRRGGNLPVCLPAQLRLARTTLVLVRTSRAPSKATLSRNPVFPRCRQVGKDARLDQFFQQPDEPLLTGPSK